MPLWGWTREQRILHRRRATREQFLLHDVSFASHQAQVDDRACFPEPHGWWTRSTQAAIFRRTSGCFLNEHPQRSAHSRPPGRRCRHSGRGCQDRGAFRGGEAAANPSAQPGTGHSRFTQFFLRIYELALQASFRADFTVEQLSTELGLVVDQLWPNYEKAVAEAGLPIEQLGTELVLGGWSPKNGRMMAIGYAKSDSQRPCLVQPIESQLASPGEPLQALTPSMAQADLMAHARLQAGYLNEQMGRVVAGGRLLAGFLQKGQAVIKDLGEL